MDNCLKQTLFTRSIHPEVFYKKIFTKFTGKHLCQNLSFNKIAGLRLAQTLVQVFCCEFCEISLNTFFYRKPPVMEMLLQSEGALQEGRPFCIIYRFYLYKVNSRLVVAKGNNTRYLDSIIYFVNVCNNLFVTDFYSS